MEILFIILFGITMIFLAGTNRLLAQIKILTLQGILLFLICYCNCDKSNIYNFIFLTIETLIIKAIVIPAFLNKIVKKTNAYRDIAANMPHFYSIFFASVILFIGFLISNLNIPAFEMINPLYFGIGIAVIIISLVLITIKHKILTNVIEFIALENGIFLLSLSQASEMPMIVNIGVLLDIFIAVYILGFLVNKINTEFHDLETSHLADLKDSKTND